MLIRKIILSYLIVFLLSFIAVYNISSVPTPEIMVSEEQVSVFDVVIYILIGSGIIIFSSRFWFGRYLIKALELLVVFVSIFFLIFFLTYPYLGDISEIISILTALGIAALRIKNMARNEIALLSFSGAAAFLGYSFSPLFTVLLLLILAIYDYISVFKTRHMIELAKTVSKEDLALMIRVGEKVKAKGIGEQIAYIEIGGGDILFPALIANSMLKVSLIIPFFVMLGTIGSVFLLDYMLRKLRQPLPALPIVGFGALSGIIIGMLFELLI